MSRTIKTLELIRYSEPDENRRVKALGMANAKEIFDKLNTHLEENGLLPDEYFLFSENNFTANNGELPDFDDAICHTNFGGSEGIYIDIFLKTDHGNVKFATAKTLREDGDAFIKMSRISAECSLMLNGYGHTYSLTENQGSIQQFKLNKNETTVYQIIEQEDNYSLLKRHTQIPGNDPSPYIVVSGLKIKANNLIEWDYGNYYRQLQDAVKRYDEIRQPEDEEDYEMDM